MCLLLYAQHSWLQAWRLRLVRAVSALVSCSAKQSSVGVQEGQGPVTPPTRSLLPLPPAVASCLRILLLFRKGGRVSQSCYHLGYTRQQDPYSQVRGGHVCYAQLVRCFDASCKAFYTALPPVAVRCVWGAHRLGLETRRQNVVEPGNRWSEGGGTASPSHASSPAIIRAVR